jgi:hypothetical protein
MSGRVLGLADALRAEDLAVVEVAGWRERGAATMDPRGSVHHHTAGARQGNAPSLSVCIYGRSDLPGPLCHVFQARDNTCYVVAAGRANHAGRGSWQGLSGNSSVLGLEPENVGTPAEPWRPDQIDTSVRVHTAFARIGGYGAGMVAQHKEWSTEGKVDAHSIDGSTFRRLVAERLAGGTKPARTAPQEDDDVITYYIAPDGAVFTQAGLQRKAQTDAPAVVAKRMATHAAFGGKVVDARVAEFRPFYDAMIAATVLVK